MTDAGLGYLAAIGVASFVLVGLSVLLNLVHPIRAVFGETTATGWTLVVLAVGLSILIAFFMAFIVLVPFIAIYRFARLNNIRSRLYYLAMGSLTGALLGGFTPIGVYGFLAGPFAGAAGGWTFWRLSVRDPDLHVD
jgi:hypothetical protein